MEWYINKGAKNCSSCERVFKEEEEYFSALYDTDSDFTRRDFCLECWGNANAKEFFSYWKTRVQKTSDTVQKHAGTNVFYDLFQRLENESNLSSVNFRYVLSLYLMRKKILRLKDTHRTNGSEILIYQNLKEGTEAKVFKPHLGREEILAVTEEIGKLLNCTPQI
jgi:hypothetical protein